MWFVLEINKSGPCSFSNNHSHVSYFLCQTSWFYLKHSTINCTNSTLVPLHCFSLQKAVLSRGYDDYHDQLIRIKQLDDKQKGLKVAKTDQMANRHGDWWFCNWQTEQITNWLMGICNSRVVFATSKK